jgi:hypothetical protein
MVRDMKIEKRELAAVLARRAKDNSPRLEPWETSAGNQPRTGAEEPRLSSNLPHTRANLKNLNVYISN